MALTQKIALGAAQRAKQKPPATLLSALAASLTAPLAGACMPPLQEGPASSSPAVDLQGMAPQPGLSLGTSCELMQNQTVPSVLPRSHLSQRQTWARHLLQAGLCNELHPPSNLLSSPPALSRLMQHWVLAEHYHKVKISSMQRHSRRRHTVQACRRCKLALPVRRRHPFPPGWIV